MTEKQFEEEVEKTLNQLKQTLIVKGKEYRRNSNPFHNFEQGAKITGTSREKVLDGFLLKHEVSVMDMVNDLDKNVLPTTNVVNEKFNDILIYNIIKKMSIIDRINKNVLSDDDGKGI